MSSSPAVTLVTESKVQSSAGPIQATFTGVAGARNITGMIALTPPGGGGGGGQTPYNPWPQWAPILAQ
jgi:hypothetical protein